MQIFCKVKSLCDKSYDKNLLNLNYGYGRLNNGLNYHSDISGLSDYCAFKIKSIKEARFIRSRWATCSIMKIGLNMQSYSIRKFKL